MNVYAKEQHTDLTMIQKYFTNETNTFFTKREILMNLLLTLFNIVGSHLLLSFDLQFYAVNLEYSRRLKIIYSNYSRTRGGP